MWGIINRNTLTGVVLFFLAIPAQASVLYPSVEDLQVIPGTEAEIEFLVRNEYSQARTYTLDVVEVDIVNEDQMRFQPLDTDVEKWFGLPEQSFELISGEVRELSIPVNIPLKTSSQTRVIGVRITESAQQHGGVGVTSGFVSLWFLTIGDDVPGEAQWLNYAVNTGKFTGIGKAYITVRNASERIIQPQGSISFIGWTGNITSTYIVNPEQARVPEGQERTYVIDFNEPWFIGPYRVRVDVAPWNGGDTYFNQETIWFFSLRAMTVIILIGLFLIGAILYARRK